MTPRDFSAILVMGFLALALLGCSSSSDDSADTRPAEGQRAQAKAKAHARAVHRSAVVRRKARIQARRIAARQAALRQDRAEQRQAQAEKEAEAEDAALEEASSDCDPNYSGCLSATASDYDCAGGSGDGPEYTAAVTVIGEDHYGLDSDSDGTGCESE